MFENGKTQTRPEWAARHSSTMEVSSAAARQLDSLPLCQREPLFYFLNDSLSKRGNVATGKTVDSGFRLRVDTGQGTPSLSLPFLLWIKMRHLCRAPLRLRPHRGPAPRPPSGPDSASPRRGLPGLPLCWRCPGSGSLAQERRWLRAIKGMLVHVYCSAGSARVLLFCFLHTERKARPSVPGGNQDSWLPCLPLADQK